MRRKLRVLFAAFEATPFMKTGGLGDVAGSLPQALKEAGCEIRVILPKFATIPDFYRNKMQHVTDFNVNLGWRNLYCGIEKLIHKNVIYYFVDNEYYFARNAAYGYYDDGERIAFFSKAIVETIGHLTDFQCDILHCNDWHTALAPIFLREFYQGMAIYENVKTVMTVHNLKFQGQMSDFVLGDILGLSNIKAAEEQLRVDHNTINFMKGGLSYSDILSTVSPSYAQEIKSSFYGEHLETIFQRRSNILYGILNGIDITDFNPSTDTAIPTFYSKNNMAGKAVCKTQLQKELGLEVNPDIPLACMIGRLTEQKGLDLVSGVFHEMMASGIQLAVLGTGDWRYEEMFKKYASQYHGQLSARIEFSEPLSRRLYAGSDMLLMPSLFEPCGLSQMIAMRYGTLPVVRETGGLKDSVRPFNQFTGEGNGFSFANYNAHELLYVVEEAVLLYKDYRTDWDNLVYNAMSEDFSWSRAAKTYLGIYYSLHPEITPYRKMETNV